MKASVGFVSSRAGFHSDGIWSEAGVVRPLQALAERYGRLTVALSSSPERSPLLCEHLAGDEADAVELPWMPSVRVGLRRWRGARRAIREVERRCDVLVVQIPFDSPLALLGARRPRVYHICADAREWILSSTRYRGLLGLPARVVARGIDRLQAALLSEPRTAYVANGEAIDRWYGGRGRVVISSALRDSEILSVQRRRPLGDGFRVLFVGFLRHEKGLDTLVAAFKILLEALPQAELEIVGAAHTVDQGVGSQLERELADLRAAGKARILPALPFGPELFQRYADADVLALPSRSEGTPRVLVEARAFRCPVVATRVGGIPSSIDDGEDGLIVPVDDPSALARALERVAADSNLRARLVERGLERARRATVEVFSSVLVEAIEDLVPDARRGQKLVRASR